MPRKFSNYEIDEHGNPKKVKPQPDGYSVDIDNAVSAAWNAGLHERQIAEKLKLPLPTVKVYAKRFRKEYTLSGELSDAQCGRNGPGVAPKLTDEQRAEIATKYADGVSQTALAGVYGVNVKTVARICNGQIREPRKDQ